MKKSNSLKILLSLVFGMSLSLTSCTDTDLDAGRDTANNTDEEELSDVDFQKRIALQCLLGGMADVDSLPDNWNSDDYHVNPSIGVAADEASPYAVRLVPTSGVEEAERIYKSLVSGNLSGTPSNDQWQCDGIGQLNFTINNQADLYATLKVNVQQLPLLQEVRFVPASAVGNNGWIAPTGEYYQFGDVVKETTTDGVEVYWVCVRPCSVDFKLRKSHWCSFQLIPEGKKKANYKKFDYAPNQPIYVPTGLANDQSDAERMIQNFFNVMRLMAKPELYNDASILGLDEIKTNGKKANETKNFKNKQYEWLRMASVMWYENGIWDKIKNSDMPDLRALVQSADNINVFYNGYSKKSKSQYLLWNMNLSTDPQSTSDAPLFNTVKKTTPIAVANPTNVKNFNEFEQKGEANFSVTDADEGETTNQYIVRYKTGGQLEDALFASSVDKTPEKEFTKSTLKRVVTSQANSGIYTNGYPIYTFGDKVTQTARFVGSQLCFKEARTSKMGAGYYGFADKDLEEEAAFVCFQSLQKKSQFDRLYTDTAKVLADKVPKDVASVLLFQMMNAYVYWEKQKSVPVDFDTRERQYYSGLSRLYTLLTYREQFTNPAVYVETNGEKVTIKVRLYMDNSTLDGDLMKHPSVACLTYDASNEQKPYTFWVDNDAALNNEEGDNSFFSADNNNFLRVYLYKDYNYNDTYSISRELNSTGDVRSKLKKQMNTLYKKFVEKCEMK